ncbi:ATP-binding protein [Actinoplanes sp. NPDC051861]|uniref:ATP-binding protein n=1 Tax=Actinoplanes sp. NPDC051861 TaxID=3155170 RepID=UPI003439FC10
MDPEGPRAGASVSAVAASGVTIGHYVQNVSVSTGHPWQLRSGYLEQVRQIAPVQLAGRDSELAELVAFCGGDEQYLTLHGEPWAGKTALLATFVLNPPLDVDVVSFFVTARFAAQSDSAAFIDAMLDQLSALVGEPVPATLTPSTRTALYLALLRQAGELAEARGRRLVLVVDGLDEDRGTDGHALPSVASQLPIHPAANLRILTSSRMGRPLPADVSVDHPLRRCRVQLINPSANAADTMLAARTELAEILHGGSEARDLIGLLAAAGGALSTKDFAALLDLPPWQLESTFSGTLGRALSSHSDLYLFAHEALRESVVQGLGPTTVASYLARIHAYADDYRTRSWPADTPEYLLRGYPRLLQTISDTERLLALATDAARHSRLLDVTGGDNAAFAEIASAYDALLRSAEPDLAQAARLALHRERLASRNAHMPANLPAVWARTGQPIRGESLALGIRHPERRDEALSALIPVLAARGDTDRALGSALSMADPGNRHRALTRLAKMAGRHGDFDTARVVIDHIDDVPRRDRALVELAMTAAGEDPDADEAVALIDGVTDDEVKAEGFATLAIHVAGVDFTAAQILFERAESAAAAVADTEARAALRQRLTDRSRILNLRALLVSGSPAPKLDTDFFGFASERALAAAVLEVLQGTPAARRDAARALHLEIPELSQHLNPVERDRLFSAFGRTAADVGLWAHARDATRQVGNPTSRVELCAYLIAGGDPDDGTRTSALDAAHDIMDSYRRASALAGLARTLSRAEQPARAVEALDLAEETALDITNVNRRAAAISQVAAVAAETGDAERTERLVGLLTDSRYLVACLTDIVARSADAGLAARSAREAESMIRTMAEAAERAAALADLAEALVTAGDADSGGEMAATAESVARGVTDAAQRAEELIALSRTARAAEDDRLAGHLKDLAVTAAAKVVDPYRQLLLLADAGVLDRADHVERLLGEISEEALPQALTVFVRAFAAIGDDERAARHSDRISDPYHRCLALSSLGRLDEATEVALSLSEAGLRVHALAEVASRLLSLGNNAEADRLIRIANEALARITDAYERDAATAALAAPTAVLHGERWSARYADLAVRDARGIVDPYQQADVLASLALSIDRFGDHDRAAAVARAITDADGSASALTRLAMRATHGRAVRLLAEALSVGGWTVVLPSVAVLDKQVGLDAVRDYLGSDYRIPTVIETPAGPIARYSVGERDFVLVDQTSDDVTVSWTGSCDAPSFLESVRRLAVDASDAPMIAAVAGTRLTGPAEIVLARVGELDTEVIAGECDFIRVDLPSLTIAFHSLGGADGSGDAPTVIVSAVLADPSSPHFGWLSGRTSNAAVASLVARVKPVFADGEEVLAVGR